ncbi:hypothetical protein HMPREF1860_00624 [Prevotella amnii]|uniref:Uncharacterized protein n=1 Tax=Prevotella amnii TaxID=419005 RepID=A0A134BHS8_9BACT|nr:hypothetical protein HMPREF1860_00624 [Prevotella amnii]
MIIKRKIKETYLPLTIAKGDALITKASPFCNQQLSERTLKNFC